MAYHQSQDKKDRIIALLRKDPELTSIALAERFGLSVSRVVRIAREAGLKPTDSREGLSPTAVNLAAQKRGVTR